LLLLSLVLLLLLGVHQAADHTRNSDHHLMCLSGGAPGCTSRSRTAALPVLQY
jgi:hypothetical protein